MFNDMMNYKAIFQLTLILFGVSFVLAQSIPIDITGFEDDIRHWVHGGGKGLKYERYDPSQILEIADNLLLFQNADGGWPKNVDWLGKLDRAVVWKRLSNSERLSTCDNRNTYTQIEYLSKTFTKTETPKYREAARRGLEFILSSQNASGGWRGADVDAITFNDDLMSGVMHLLLDIREGRDYYNWIDEATRKRADEALARAIRVTLHCQIIVDGKKTGWCQQHDHKTFAPVKARSYELPAIASLETTSVVEFLMRIKKPDQKIIDAVESAMAWLEKSKLGGILVQRIPVSDDETEVEYRRADPRVVNDSHAPPIWARYYEIETNRPFFANRDGVKVYSLAEVKQERRMGYAWYGYWPDTVLSDLYPKWKERIAQ